jgi:hypothetical protein
MSSDIADALRRGLGLPDPGDAPTLWERLFDHAVRSAGYPSVAFGPWRPTSCTV